MTRRTKIRTAHVASATFALAVTNAWTSYAETQRHHTDSGAWSNQIVAGWILLLLSALWVLAWGCYGVARLVSRLFMAPPEPVPPTRTGRPAPGEDNRAPSPSLDQWASWDVEYANLRAANAWMNGQRMDDTQPMLLADIAGLDDRRPLLVDEIAAYGIAPDYVAGASAQAETLRDWFGNAFQPAA